MTKKWDEEDSLAMRNAGTQLSRLSKNIEKQRKIKKKKIFLKEKLNTNFSIERTEMRIKVTIKTLEKKNNGNNTRYETLRCTLRKNSNKETRLIINNSLK